MNTVIDETTSAYDIDCSCKMIRPASDLIGCSFPILCEEFFCLGVISSLNSGCQNLKISYVIDQRNNIASSSLIKIYL